MAKHKKNTEISTEQLRRYVAGALSPAEQHQVEKTALQKEQIDDTLEGLQALKAASIEEEEVLKSLSRQLRQRIKKRERKLLPFYYASAAALIFAVGLGWWLIRREEVQDKQTSVIALQQPIVKPEAAPAVESPLTLPPRSPAVSKPTYVPPTSKPDAAIIQEREPPLALILEEKKTRVPEVAAVPEPVQDTQDLDTVRVVAAKDKTAFKTITGSVSSIPRGSARKTENVAGFTIRGKVMDAEDKTALPGVSLSLIGRGQGVMTDSAGKFVLPNLKKGDQIQIASVGYERVQMTVKDSVLSPILLKQDTRALSETVVVGYGKNRQNTKGPMPENGWKAYNEYLKTSAKTFIVQHPQAPRGRVRIEFSVNDSGEAVDFKNVNKADSVLFEEAIRIIKNGAGWNTKFQNGKSEASKIRLAIRFE